MAIKLNAAYSKKLGLPNYSSHSFAASVEVELTDPGTIAAETARLYATLQTSVDNEIRQVGYLPAADDIHRKHPPTNGGNGSRNGNGSPRSNGNGNGNGNHHPDSWRCSDKQRDLINRLITENGLDRAEIEDLAQQRFRCGLASLNRLQASGIIDELLERFSGNNGNGRGRQPVGNGGAQR